nr:MAG TPA: hypothetical protein [Caudoviricetes sp.]
MCVNHPAQKCAGIFYAASAVRKPRAALLLHRRGGDVSREDGYKNLVPMDQRSKDEARSLGQQGGIASGAARRRKRSMREAADYYLSLPETDRRRVNAMLRDAIDPEDIDNQMAVVMGVTERAKRGDPQAASVLLKMLGEDTVQEDSAADALAKAKELLGGVDSAID